jgi:NDP-sugar pyrophosphorylase family protein
MTDLSRWPALVLTAGLATRLRPLSEVRAKAAMPVAGTAIIVRIIHWLRAAGIRRVVVNLHHRPETITALLGDGSEYGVSVRYSWEPRVLGSAGGPRHALPLLDADTFFVVNGDTLTDCSLAAVGARHRETGARVTLAVVDGNVERYGGVLVDERERVRGFGRGGGSTRAYHFIGVQAVNAEVFAALPDDEPAETVRMLYPRLIDEDERAMTVYRSTAEFLDVGTARDYLETVATIAARERHPFDIGQACEIAADAHVSRSILWDRVRIGAGARVVNCILADDVVVPPGATLADQVVVRDREDVRVLPL